MTATYLEARTPKTATELRASALAALTGAPVAGWSENAPQRRLVDNFSERLAEETVIRALLAKTVSPQEAVAAGRDWVRAIISWFGEDFTPAQAAVWDVTLTVAPAEAPLVLDGATVVQLQATNGEIFTLAATSSVLLSSASAPTAYQGVLRFAARAAGTAGNVSPSSITKIISGPAGLSIVGTPTLYTAGADEESSEAAIKRCLGKWARLGAGWTAAAFDYFVPTARPSLTRWRLRDDNPLGPGTVLAILANAAGPATAPEVAAVQSYCGARDVKSLGSGQFTAQAAVADTLAIAVALKSDGTNAALASDAAAALAALCAAFPIGPATLDDTLVAAVVLGGSFASIPVVAGAETVTITPALPGFSGAIGIDSITLAAPHDVPNGRVLGAIISVSVV